MPDKKHTHTHVHEDGTVHTHTHEEGAVHTHTHTDGTVITHSHGDHVHKHVHSVAEKKAVMNRLAKISGHLEHVRTMVENDEDCSDVLIQIAAVRSALNSAGRLILSNHIDHCIKEAMEEGDTETIDKLNEAIKMFVK
ncbi:MAG: metal-sensing transcriptional repressor [Mogibacterium sp.]|nr:metal-sensing transcriptional repressor [Mogibacterium sp.]